MIRAMVQLLRVTRPQFVFLASRAAGYKTPPYETAAKQTGFGGAGAKPPIERETSYLIGVEGAPAWR